MVRRPFSDPEALPPDPATRGVVPAADDDAWHTRLRGALGDDDALLALLHDAAPLAVKHSAVAELQGEAALRVAERALRDQDRALHRVAKRRRDSALARRHTRELATALIIEARTLAGTTAVSLERLVEIDRRWQSLDARLIDAAQRDDYAALSAELSASSRRAPPIEPSSPGPLVPATQPSQAPPSAADLKRRRAVDAKRDEAAAGQTAFEQQLDAELCAAHAALAEGHVAQVAPHLAAIKRLLESASEPLAPMRMRIDALQAEYAHLVGWRQWSGGRAREDLVRQAEALVIAPTGPVLGPNLPLRRRAEQIHDLRARWKALDQSGTISPRSLWRRFDTALTTAYRPVAEHMAAQHALRERNREERERLLAALEAVPLPADRGPPDDVRTLAATIERFRGDWRRLGPLEHSVAPAARRPLASRMAVALQRLEAPLQGLRSAALAERERLVRRAESLAGDVHDRDPLPRLRELQSEWQRQARALPLARAEEGLLWNHFRAAIDAAFAAREAVFKARDAEQQALRQQRAECVAALEALPEDLTPAQITHALAKADAQWQRLHAAAHGLDGDWQARFERARERLRRRVADQARRAWLATCDALQAKLARCESLEDDGGRALDAHELAHGWSGMPALPEPLEQALAGRAGLKPALAPLANPTDELLLQFEDRWALPTPPAFAESRRALKLLQLKAALESRRASMPPAPLPQLAALLARTGLNASQRERLRALLDELRRRGPNALSSGPDLAPTRLATRRS